MIEGNKELEELLLDIHSKTAIWKADGRVYYKTVLTFQKPIIIGVQPYVDLQVITYADPQRDETETHVGTEIPIPNFGKRSKSSEAIKVHTETIRELYHLYLEQYS